ncbi:MAG: hypothetical protein ING29_19800 [Azospirillum sp.]|nr:hypothetical protein [Azospirillum sp.]
MQEKIELNQSPENTAPETSDNAAANRRPAKKRPQSAPGEGVPALSAGPSVDRSAAPASDLAGSPAQPTQASVRQVAEFRLDEVELPPKSEVEQREHAKAEEMADERAELDVEVKARAVKLNELRRKSRQADLELERQANIVTAAGLAGAVTADLRERGFTLDRIKRLLALIARTPLTPDEVAALIAPYVK